MEILVGLVIVYVIYRMAKGGKKSKKPPQIPEVTLRVEVSSSGGRSSNYEGGRRSRPSGKPARWVGLGEAMNIQGHSISSGLFYLGDSLPDSYGYSNDACLINPKLKALPREPWQGGDEMGYWPQYSEISPKCRGAYLSWLAGGRSEPEAYIGYVFLFFYGLERRLFIDGQKAGISDQERLEVVNEVRRLLSLYGDNRSFKGYASNFLAMEWVLYQSDKPVPEYMDFSDRYCSEPFQVVLAKQVVEQKPVPAEMALQWMMLHPEFGLRTPARRCAEEFRTLFLNQYAEKYGEGLIVKPNKTPLRLEYRAASSSLRGDLNLKVPELPNPFILKAPVNKISAIAEECTDKLEAYSRFLGRKGNDPTSLAALALLPKELIGKSSNAQQATGNLAKICEHGPGLISVETLYGYFGEALPAKLSKKDSENLSALVEAMGFGLAPDVRFHGIKPNPDGRVVISRKGHGIDFRPSKEFRTVGSILRLGAMVSQIDDDLSPAEEGVLTSLVKDNRELTNIEKDSLLAFLYWSLRTPQGVAGLKQGLAELSKEEKTAISHILVTVAHADGRIDPKEVKQLEKLYTTLGLDKKQVTNDLHSLAAANEPVTVSRRDDEASFSIPGSPGKPAPGFQLNEELIRIREAETHQVRGVLESIFTEPEEEEIVTEASSVGAVGENTLLNSLDEAHQDLFHQLIGQETWERSKLHEMCEKLGLMVDGAMEVINEWAFENVNAPLIEDGEPVYIDLELAKEISNG